MILTYLTKANKRVTAIIHLKFFAIREKVRGGLQLIPIP